MTDDQRNAKQGAIADASTRTLGQSKSAKRRAKKKGLQINKREESESPMERRTKDETEQETVAELDHEENDEGASSKAMSEGSTMEEGTDSPEQDTTRPQTRSHAYSYANPTQASEAKKNEKIELPFVPKKAPTFKQPPSRPGTAMQQQQPASVLGSQRYSPQKNSAGSLGNKEYEDVSDRSASPSITSRKGKGHRRTRSRSLNHSGNTSANLGAPFTIERWQQEDAEGVGESSVQAQIESEIHNTKVENKSEDVRFRKESPDVVLGKVVVAKEALETQLEALKKERDESAKRLETTQAKLQNCTKHGKELEHDDDKLQDEIKELRKQIAAHTLQTQESSLVATEADNKRHREAVEDLERKLAEMTRELKTKEKDEKDMLDEIYRLQDELNESDETLKKLRTYNETLSGIVDKVSQTLSTGATIDFDMLQKLTSSLPVEIDESSLQSAVFKLIPVIKASTQALQTAQENQERQIADKVHKISILERAMEAQEQESRFHSPLSPGLLSLGLLGPLSPSQAYRDSFERLFNDERRKRKAVEEKLVEVKASTGLERHNRELQVELARTREELVNLRKRTDDFETRSKLWQEEAEETKAEHLKCSLAFDKSIAQQQQEVHKHVQEYLTKTQDPMHWEVQGLQKQLAAVEADPTTTNKLFDQRKSENEHRGNHIKRLTWGNSIRDTHIGNIVQAHYSGAKLSTLPPVESEPNDDAEFSIFSDSFLWLKHPRSIPRYVIPACLLPSAIDKRAALLREYREELRLAREKEVLAFSMEPPSSNRFVQDELMEKVRRWKLRTLYPPEKYGWKVYKAKSAWERWEGARWVKECTISRKDIKILRSRGLWQDA